MHSASVYQPPKLFSASVGSLGFSTVVPLSIVFTIVAGSPPLPFLLNVTVTTSPYLTFKVTYICLSPLLTLYLYLTSVGFGSLFKFKILLSTVSTLPPTQSLAIDESNLPGSDLRLNFKVLALTLISYT